MGGEPMSEQDFTTRYNTALTAKQEKRFQTWAKAENRLGDLFDYDMRGAWLQGAKQGGNGHFTDQFKKPNHPTFSVESQYNGVDGLQGGQWLNKDGADVFQAAPANLAFRSPQDLVDYFKRVEPSAAIVLPPAPLRGTLP